jgi:hypothetical protein
MVPIGDLSATLDGPRGDIVPKSGRLNGLPQRVNLVSADRISLDFSERLLWMFLRAYGTDIFGPAECGESWAWSAPI